MKVVLVELSNETCEIAVLEMLGKDGFRESFILSSGSASARSFQSSHIALNAYLEDYEAVVVVAPSYDVRI